MRTWISIICAGVLALAGALSASAQSIYDFTVKAQDGSTISLSEYKGKVLLIVNTATECGFTPQYKELEALYRKFQDKGLVILDFPCNQFGAQAPGSDAEIHEFCTGKYAISFPQFAKIDVNGPDAAPLFTWLKSQQGFKGFGNGQIPLPTGSGLPEKPGHQMEFHQVPGGPRGQRHNPLRAHSKHEIR